MLSIRQGAFPKIGSLEIFLGCCGILFFFLVCLFPQFLPGPKILLAIAMVPVALLAALNVVWSILFVITVANLHIYAFGMHLAIYAAYLIVFSYLLRKRQIFSLMEWNPIRGYFLAYVILTLPSLVNTSDVAKSLFNFLNLVSVFILFELIKSAIDDRRGILKIAKVFLALTTLNSLYLFFLSFRHSSSDGRIFGFTGIVFVDFACVSILILFSILAFSNKRAGLWVAALLGITFLALILTQTRNTLISLALSIATVMIYVFCFARAMPVTRLKLAKRSLVGIALFSVFIGGVVAVKPEIFHRQKLLMSSESNKKGSEGLSGLSSNSIGTRLMIWVTAANGFRMHPVVGIGAYSFAFNSKRYNILPKILYKSFVENLSPHVTYFAVLCETGIIGMAGFLVLIFASLRVSFRSLSMSVTDEQKLFSLTILLVHLYVTFSMAFTDAWLWHQCAIVWGTVMGITMVNHAILIRESAPRPALEN